MSLIEIAAGLFIASWIFGALMKIGAFLLDDSGPPVFRPSRPGEWKEGLRNMAIGIGGGLALYWLA